MRVVVKMCCFGGFSQHADHADHADLHTSEEACEMREPAFSENFFRCTNPLTVGNTSIYPPMRSRRVVVKMCPPMRSRRVVVKMCCFGDFSQHADHADHADLHTPEEACEMREPAFSQIFFVALTPNSW